MTTSNIKYADKLTEKLSLTLNILCSTNDSISGYYTASDIVIKMLERLHPGNMPDVETFKGLCAQATTLLYQRYKNDSKLTRSSEKIACIYESPFDHVHSRKRSYGYRVPGKILSAINKDMVAESAILSRQAEEIAKNPLETIKVLLEGLTFQQLSEVIGQALELKDIRYHSEKLRVAELAAKLKDL